MSSPLKSIKSCRGAATPSGLFLSDNGTLLAPSTSRSTILLKFLHWFVGALLLLAVVSPAGYHVQAIYRKNLAVYFTPWFNIDPKDKARYAPGKEMLPVAYFFLFFILPVVVAALVFNLTKTVYRGSSFRFLHIEPRWLCCQISYGELAFLGVVLGGNIIVFYQSYLLQIGFDKPTITCIAIALGFSGLYNMVFMALPATRHCFWMEWLNLPWARGVKYHRWLGVLTIVSFVLHFAFFIVQYAITDTLAEELLPCFDCDIATDGKYAWFNVFGELSLLFMLIMGATSFPYVRRHYYATFKATHWLFIPAAFTAVMHYEQIIIWIYVSMVLYIVNRMYSSSTVAYPAALETATALPGQIVQLTFKCSTTYLPADLVYVKVPAISTVQWHPFSIASTPLHTPGLLTIYVKALGHWTSQLHDYVKQCEGEGVQPVVYMDAGYTPPPPMSSSYSSVVFVGGGIGVTPLMAQIMHLLHARPHQDVYLVWHVRTVEMLSQFHGWLRELEDVAEANHGRLHLHLHVTQKGRTDIAVVPAADADRIAPSFDLTRFRAPPRPYAHLSTVRKLGVLLLAFLCSGTLLVYVRFGQKFTKLLGPEYWPLQRFMEFLVVVVGSYCAYGVAVVGHASEPTEGCEIDLRQPQRREVRPGDLLQHFAVKYERANWNQLFHDIQVDKFGFPPNSVGVYVSGPNALAKAIRDVTNHHTLFDVHVEEFEM